MINYFAGIDVQISRGCSYYIIEGNKKFVTNGWVKKDIPKTIKTILSEICDGELEAVAIGIDAPRMPIKKLRIRYFDKKNNVWVKKSKKCFGRECEVIIKSHNIANPQWTRTYAESPKWMKLGFEIFSELKDFPFVYEVFPSASYKMLENENVNYELCLNEFTSGVKDMLDASVAAFTVFEFVNKRGCEVGGEDNLGTIVLPRKIFL
jgi:hypothetical protein